MTDKIQHGGKRPNQTGRPKAEPYKTISFRASIVDIDKAKLKHGKSLNSLFKAWLKRI